jgi:glycosyltransferase involved in cell wall biosynthesis
MPEAPGPAGTRLEILMATRNGERYVAEQIRSILAQTDDGWTLTVRDDCSTDGTVRIVTDLEREHPDRIAVRRRETPSGSAARSFLEMIAASTADYVMLCDQDDVWAADKVAVTRAAMRRLETGTGQGTPLLVHTDLTVTDENLRVVAGSMMRAQQLDGAESRLTRLVVQNMVTGCTVMVNRPLLDLVREPFDGVVMHDWWLALIASALGEIGFVETPTVRYRQHEENAVGARPSRGLGYKVNRLLDAEGVRRSLNDAYPQAGAFLDLYADRLTADQVAVLTAFVGVPGLGKVGRLRVLRRHGLWKNTAARRLGQVLFV